ncbi:MAG: agmatinase [Hyphomicrobiales bacterium]|jgi:agmatinase|nr:agmatinase [Hyphomicrobiales bacterium]
MTGVATFAVPPTFLGIDRDDPGSPICVAGIPFDLGTTNRVGARFGPSAIRQASRMLVDGDHPLHWVNPSALPLADVGNFTIALGDIAGSLARIEEQAARIKHLVAFGGDHGITLPLLRALAKRRGPPALIHLDAHVDTWPENFGQTYAHGSVFYHALSEGLVEPQRMVQVGIRSPVERGVHDWTLAQGVVMITAQDVHEQGPAAIAGRIRQVIGEAPVYLSFDIDVLDPAFAPGTGTPEIGGLATWQAQAIIRRLGGLQFIGMDLVEVCPAYDVAEITALAGATIAWEYLCLLGVARSC